MNRRLRENKSRFTEEVATPTGIEPVLSDVTDRCFSLLNYGAVCTPTYLCTDGVGNHPFILLRFLFSIVSTNREPHIPN